MKSEGSPSFWDISKILEAWPFDPDEVGVRVIQGDDGASYIQMRADLGLFQMRLHARPDGKQIKGFESWLEYYEDCGRAHEESGPFRLDLEACDQLWYESVQYYHRYVSFWYLRWFDLCARDTGRNLRLYDFIRAYAPDERTKLKFDQWRPYVWMMHVRARTIPLLERARYDEAVPIFDLGIEGIRQFLTWYTTPEETEDCPELMDLRRRREDLLEQALQERIAVEPSAVHELRIRLDRAVRMEDYERAARLRDALRETEKD